MKAAMLYDEWLAIDADDVVIWEGQKQLLFGFEVCGWFAVAAPDWIS